MGYTMETAGSETHVRVVAVALVLSIILAWIGIAASG
jgi:hypothetical protein